MKLTTEQIWNEHYTGLYFFTMKKVKNQDAVNEVIQNTFIKIHSNIGTVRNPSKVKAWTYQIVRNEINNLFNQNKKLRETALLPSGFNSVLTTNDLCCLDRFIEELPENYKQVIKLVYLDGKTMNDTAEELNISLANVKARIRRSKKSLKENFNKCCKFRFDKNGKLVGEANCEACDSV